MSASYESRAFEDLRSLAERLDVMLGIESRKLILAGNEKLTFATDSNYWSAWMFEVQNRLQTSVGTRAAEDLLLSLMASAGSGIAPRASR